MEKVIDVKAEDIHVFYMMNGQVLFANYVEQDEETGDYVVERPVMVMIGQAKQVAMSTAFPFTNIDEKVRLNWRTVTATSSLEWNTQLVTEYGKFWQALRAKAAGIEVVPAGAGPIDLNQRR